MALSGRSLLSFLRVAHSLRGVQTASPTVFDKMIQLTVILPDGRRFPIRGLAGDSLANVLHRNEGVFGSEVVCLSPEGRNIIEAHCKLPNELLQIYPTAPLDARMLKQVAIDASHNSRLASTIKLSKDMDQSTIAVGEVQPWATL